MKSTPGTTLAKKPGMSRVKLAMRLRPTGPLVLFMLDEGRGGHRIYCTKSGANCLVIKCNEFSQVTLATHLAHPFMTA